MRTQRKYFPSFQLKLSPSAAINFVAESLLLFLLASVKSFGFAFSLALFCGFSYARQNIVALAPAFIIACCVFMLSWWTLLYCACPLILLFLLYAAFFKMKRNVPLWAVALTALAGMTPYIACSCVFDAAYILSGISALFSVVGTFVAGISCYAILVRKSLKYSLDELICIGLMAVAFGYALHGADIYGFKLIYIAAGFILLLSSICFKTQTTLFAGLLLGIGGALQGGDLGVLAGLALLSVTAICFAPFTKWASALGMLVLSGAMWLFNASVDSGWRMLVMLAIGVIPCLCIPRAALSRLKDLISADPHMTYAGIVNRQARQMANRLYAASEVFYDMSKNMETDVNAESLYTPDSLAKEVARGYCMKCADREECLKQLGGDTSAVLKPMAEAALNRGKVTILDIPTFVTTRCTRMHALASVIDSSAKTYIRKRDLENETQVGKTMMSEQFAGVALILDSLARECSMPVSFAGGDIEFLKAELLKHNIVASEVVISSGQDVANVAVTVRAQDANKAALPKLLSGYLRRKLTVVKAEDRGEHRIVYLQSAPIYEVAYGIAEKARDGAGASGDSRSVLCPSMRRRLFAICDGMGSGEDACKASKDAVGMIESFYRAGFDNGIILSLVNKLLRISLKDSFSSLDISVIDTATGALDVIKLGSASSFIVRKDSIEVISCSLPPAGILDSVQPVTVRQQLYDGDMFVMMSDGVYDALEAAGVAAVADETSTVNPQQLADALLSRALKEGAKDDCTVMVMRLFAA